MTVPSPAQAQFLSLAWFGKSVPIATEEDGGNRTPTAAACLKRGWLARVPGEPGIYPSGATFHRYVLSPDGLRAMAAFLEKAAGSPPLAPWGAVR